MSQGVIVDTNVWQAWFRRHRRKPPVVDVVETIVRDGLVWIHPTIAGEVLLGGVSPYDAFDGMRWLTRTVPDDEILDWLAQWPAGTVRNVGWADVQIAHAAWAFELDVLTLDEGLKRLVTLAKP